MYSNDTNKLLSEIKSIQSKKGELSDILNSIKSYLTTDTLNKSLNIIYKLIRDNYCIIYPKITSDINQSNRLTKLNNKLDTIIFLSPQDRNHIQTTLSVSYNIKAQYKSNTINMYIIQSDNKLNTNMINRMIGKLFTLIELFTNKKNTIFNIYGYLILRKKHLRKYVSKHFVQNM